MFNAKVLLDEGCIKKVGELYNTKDSFLILVGNTHMLYNYGIPAGLVRECPGIQPVLVTSREESSDLSLLLPCSYKTNLIDIFGEKSPANYLLICEKEEDDDSDSESMSFKID